MRFLFWLVLILLSFQLNTLEVSVRAPCVLLMNADTGAVLFERDAHIPAHPASTTKIATALYTLDRDLDLDRAVTVSRESMRSRSSKGEIFSWLHEPDGTMMGLKVGEVITIDTLLHGLILVSGNDAANVLAENLGGSIPLFMEGLNQYLMNIGCKNTQFRNPHGLTDLEHFSTAYDLALITQKALKIPKFRELISTLSYIKPANNKQAAVEIKLTNPLLRPQSRYYYPKAIGVKTGYTSAAKQTLVAAAEHEGRRLIGVLLGCETREERFEDAKKLFEAAFNEVKMSRRLVGSEHVFKTEVIGAKKALRSALTAPLVISFFPSEEPECKAILYWTFTQLPIRKGQKVGEVHILDSKGQCLTKGDLVALEDLKTNFIFFLKDNISKIF